LNTKGDDHINGDLWPEVLGLCPHSTFSTFTDCNVAATDGNLGLETKELIMALEALFSTQITGRILRKAAVQC
jgi:hypothetical protein